MKAKKESILNQDFVQMRNNSCMLAMPGICKGRLTICVSKQGDKQIRVFVVNSESTWYGI